MISIFKRIIKLGWLSFSRDIHLAAATVFILVLTILLVSSLFLFKEVSRFMVSSLQEKVDISVYFKEESAQEDILKAKEEIANIPDVKDVEYISRDQAMEDFKQRYKDNPVLLESLQEIGKNPFLPSLNIRAWEASQYESISQFLEKADFKSLVEKIDYSQRKSVIERIFNLSSIAEKVGIALSIILAIIAVLVAFNTIRLAIYSQREEVKIQRLVGASNWFIRGPFLVQGVILGIFSTIISFAIFGFACWTLGPKAEFFFRDLNLFTYFTAKIWIIVLIQTLTGVGLAVASSIVALRKYLKV